MLTADLYLCGQACFLFRFVVECRGFVVQQIHNNPQQIYKSTTNWKLNEIHNNPEQIEQVDFELIGLLVMPKLQLHVNDFLVVRVMLYMNKKLFESCTKLLSWYSSNIF